MYHTQGTLAATPPFDFNHSLRFVEAFRPAMGQQTTDNGVLTSAFSQAGDCIAFRVRSTGTMAQPRLGYTLFSETELTDESRSHAADYIAFFLSLSDDLTPSTRSGGAIQRLPRLSNGSTATIRSNSRRSSRTTECQTVLFRFQPYELSRLHHFSRLPR
jgi:hypothetical protein